MNRTSVIGLSLTLALNLLLSLGCGGDNELESPDGELDEGVTAGKADGGEFSDCELAQVLILVNDPATTDTLLIDDGVHSRAARNIVDYRDNVDENGVFDDIQEVDDVSYVGPVAFQQLVDLVSDRCIITATEPEVIFSPQDYDESHLMSIVAAINEATMSADIAIYSFSDGRIEDAIEDALGRGVQVRVLYQGASDHRRDPDGTMSARLETMGVEVRYINKINHHKYIIIDGPQSSLEQARTAVLITGSANWSNSAATKYDENTVIIRGNSEVTLRFQREFNHLWANSRDFVYNEDIEHITTMEIAEDVIIDDPGIDAVFTSDNYRTYVNSTHGPTFSVIAGENAVSDRLVQLIEKAQQSIHVASGHLRSRPVAEALIARQEADPDLDIRVYLDNQEYVSTWSHDDQEQKLDECLADASTDSQVQSCLDRGFLFSYSLHLAGVSVRFKYYCYRWNYVYAPQMHNKYMIIDGRTLVSGSYNLSDNAEHNTMENIVIYQSEAYPELVAAFEENFETLWSTSEEEGLYDALLDEIINGTGDSFPIVFDAMAIDWQQVTDLRNAIYENCPDISSDEYRASPGSYQVCYR